jgi:hypothetical protein
MEAPLHFLIFGGLLQPARRFDAYDDFHVLRFGRSFLAFREIVHISCRIHKEALPQFSGFRCFETTPSLWRRMIKKILIDDQFLGLTK